MTVDLLSLTPEAAQATLQEWLAARGEPAYRLRQVAPRLWQRPVAAWKDATDLPEPLRDALAEAFPLRRLSLKTHQQSSDGTQKFLWDLGDGEAIESVSAIRARATMLVRHPAQSERCRSYRARSTPARPRST